MLKIKLNIITQNAKLHKNITIKWSGQPTINAYFGE